MKVDAEGVSMTTDVLAFKFDVATTLTQIGERGREACLPESILNIPRRRQ